MSTKSYPLIRSTLEGIFGAQAGYAETKAALNADLQYEPFRRNVQAEVTTALADESLSVRGLLDECDVGYFETEDEARAFFEREFVAVVRSVPSVL